MRQFFRRPWTEQEDTLYNLPSLATTGLLWWGDRSGMSSCFTIPCAGSTCGRTHFFKALAACEKQLGSLLNITFTKDLCIGERAGGGFPITFPILCISNICGKSYLSRRHWWPARQTIGPLLRSSLSKLLSGREPGMDFLLLFIVLGISSRHCREYKLGHS